MSTLIVDAEIRRGSFSERITVRAEPGGVLAVLGPNGSGKSTLLRAVAGLLPIASGRLSLGEQVLDDTKREIFVPAQQRPVGMVFQDYRLFPGMSLRDNVAFGPRMRGQAKSAARRVADTWLARMDLTEFADRRPGAVSGGQAQRAALARALAAEPELLLLDEPLAALDAQTRLQVQSRLRAHLAEFAGPVLLVTHDPLEALVLADRLLVLEGGRVVQQGAPAEVARRPATEYVARLVGLNLWSGRRDGDLVRLEQGGTIVTSGAPGQTDVLVSVRPASIGVHREEPHDTSARNIWPGKISGMTLLTDRVRLTVDGSPTAMVDVTPMAVAEMSLAAGDGVWLSLKATDVEAYAAP